MIRENYVLLGSRGILKGLYIKDVVATSSDADVIHVFADFDTSTESTSYRAIARVRRPDGELYGPTLLPLTVAEFDAPEDALAIGIDENAIVGPDVVTGKFQVACRDLTLSQQMLELTGEVGVTIVYQEVDSLGAYVRDIATSYVVVTVRDAIPTLATEEEYSDLLEIFLPRDLGDLTDGVQPTVTDKILVRQGGATKLITVGQLNDLLETGITIFKKIAMDTASPAPTLSIGETRWNAEVETLETRVSNDVYLQHGQELIFKCKNTSGDDIANGTPVYVSGASGSSPNFYIAKASSSDYVQTSRCIGLTTERIYDGAWGKVCVIGIVNGLNTNTFEVGDVVYLGAGGIITTVRPTTNVLALGVVIQKSLTDGRIALRPIFFPRPEDLSTVHYSGLANGDILVKDATGWTNYALTNKANVADLTAGTITVKKAEQDKDGNAIDTTYVKVSGVNAMTGNLNLGTNKIINLVDGVGNQDGATIKNIDTKITAHDGSETAHLYIRELIEALEQEVERLDGRGKSYGEIDYTTAQLLTLSQEILDDTITDAVALGHGGTGYTPSNGDLVYDTGVGAGVSYHEWEFNGTNWVDNGMLGFSKASNDVYGMIKGDSTYLSIVSGLAQVLKSDYANKIGTSGGSYTYAQLLSAFADRYTKAEVDALLDALKTAFGWEETDLGTYSAPVDLSSYDLVLLQLIATDVDNYVYTQMIKPADYATNDIVSLIAREPADDSIVGAGVIIKGATTWTYEQVTSTPILKMRGYKIAPIIDENVEGDYTGSTYIANAENVHAALVELDAQVGNNADSISDIEDGTTIAAKATNDAVGNKIDTTYATKQELTNGLGEKVDKVEGKQLSTNDFTSVDKEQIQTNAEDIVGLETCKEDIANKGVANGYAPLNASGIVDPIYVPGAYTDYVEYATYANLPATGVEGTLYVVIADETSGGNTLTYRWTGSIYVNVTDKLSASEVKALYESNANTNAYTDDEKSKLSDIEPNAEVNNISDADASELTGGEETDLHKHAAADVNITDTGEYYDSTDVEGVLQEVGSELASIASHIEGIDVTEQGAKGDGNTDDTSAIKSAITLAGENGILFFPPNKTYMLSAKLYGLAGQTWYGYGACIKRINEIKTTTTDSITTSTNPTVINVADASGFKVGMEVTVTAGRNNNQGCYISHRISAINGNTITVDGKFTVAFPSGGTVVTNHGLISVLSGEDNFKIYGLELDGNRANNDSYLNWQSQAAISCGSNYAVLKDVYIHDSQTDGIMFGGTGTVVDSCSIINSGGNAIHISGATGVKIVNCYCKDATLSITGTDNTTGPDHAEGVITFSSWIEDTIIANNHLENGRTCIGGIGSNDNSDITITGNTMRGATYQAIDIVTGEITAPYMKNIVITNNRFYDCAPVSLANTQSGGIAYESGNRNIIFSDNLLQNTQLRLQRLKHATISGNIIDLSGDTTGSALYALYLIKCKSITIYHNQAIGGRYGIYLDSAIMMGIELDSSDVIINGNQFRNQTDVSISLSTPDGARYKNVIASNNTILIESGAMSTYVGIYAGSGVLVADNTLNIVGGSRGISCQGDILATPYGYQGAIIKGNIVRTESDVTSIRVPGGYINNVIHGNYVVQAIINGVPDNNIVENNYTII